MGKFMDLTNRRFGDWLVLKYLGNRYWLCRCLKCNKVEKPVFNRSLIAGTSTSCGCGKTNIKPMEDLSKKQFGEWTVLEYDKNKYNHWICQCSCEKKTIKSIERGNLTRGKTKSCGCKRKELQREKLYELYGDVVTSKVGNPREDWQIQTLEDKDKLRKYIIDNYPGYKPTFYMLAEVLGVTRHTVSAYIHKYMLENLVDIDPLQSQAENELYEFVRSITDCEIIRGDKSVIHPYELDMYIPEKNLAIEFNGTYWHSDIKIDKIYHQNKTRLCCLKNVRLIHIFEYEWKQSDKRKKIQNYLQNIFRENVDKVYARKLMIKELDNKEVKEFFNENHLQGHINSTVNIALVDEYNNIVQAMSFGKSRYDESYEYELYRIATMHNKNVIGGSEKLFKYFIKTYKPKSIVSYCSIDKFIGSVYSKLKFKLANNSITEPNYVWVNNSDNTVLTRYQTQKHKLLQHGIGKPEQTESEIMREAGYYKIYDCGNLKFEWRTNIE